jgi:hypothetical protein
MCHARGVKTVNAITPMIELAKRKCLIVSDGDKTAREYQKLHRQEKGFGEWKTYQDIDPAIEAITGEDFLDNDFIARQVNAALAGKNMPDFSASILPSKRDKIAAISRWLTDNGMTGDQAKDTITKVKNTLFEDLKRRNIEDTYKALLRGISF